MTLRFADISHHQNDAGLNLDTFLNNLDGVVAKATQGTGYTDPKYGVNIGAARSKNKLRGSYHFAGNTGQVPANPITEANYYISKMGWQRGEIPILDWEPTKPPADPDDWCYQFCKTVIDAIGIVPWVYMNTSTAASRSWAKTRGLGCALWVARYYLNNGQISGGPPSAGPWGGYAAWQYTSNGKVPGASGVVDLNEFYGDATAWLKYGGAGGATPSPGGSDMPLNNDDFKLLFYNTKFRGQENLAQFLHRMDDTQQVMEQQITGLTAAVSTLSEAVAANRDDLTADELRQAVAQGIMDGGAAIQAATDSAKTQ